eukprot:scaffold4897_cov129-Cylindrotheca_fusiformis.AAC.6
MEQHHEEAEDEVWIYTNQVTDSDDGDEKEASAVGMIPSNNNVKVIDTAAFYGCKLLTNKEGLFERIGKGAFEGCESLTIVDLPSTVQVIDDFAFQECKLLFRLGLNEGLERIGRCAFSRCISLKEVSFPSTVKVIDNGAFEECKLLGSLLGLNEGLLQRIGKSAFRKCDSLTEVEMPSTVKVIDSRAFNKCKLLKRLVLNEGLETIEENAFSYCHSLSHVRIPYSTVLGSRGAGFAKCSNLISIELPEECSFNIIDLSGCKSLVSLACPTTTRRMMPTFRQDIDREEFFERSKLGTILVDNNNNNEANLIHRLNHRFDNAPLNKLCYYQSYLSLDDAMAQLSSLMDENPLAATAEVDVFGMTPLHLLSLSQTPNLDMLLAVMDAGKRGHMVRNRDFFGCTPMDYLCLNRSMPNSAEVVIQRLFQSRYDQVLGLSRMWNSEILLAIYEAWLGVGLSSRRSEVDRVVRKFEWKERKEILSLLELCLWKVKIDEMEDTSNKQMLLVPAEDRQKCRYMSGAAVIIPHVLPFLDSIS